MLLVVPCHTRLHSDITCVWSNVTLNEEFTGNINSSSLLPPKTHGAATLHSFRVHYPFSLSSSQYLITAILTGAEQVTTRRSAIQVYRPRWFTEMATRTVSFCHVLTKTVQLRTGACPQHVARSGVSSGSNTCASEPRDSPSDEGGPEQHHRERRDTFSLAPVSPPRELQTALDNVLACKQ